MNTKSRIQYASAVLLIISSIVLAFVQVFEIDDINNGVLLYIAQAFLLTGSIFGLEFYLHKFNKLYNGREKTKTEGTEE